MKYLFMLILFGCAYDDICPKNSYLRQVDAQIEVEHKTISAIMNQGFNTDAIDQLSAEIDNLDALEVEKLIIENMKCQ